MWSRQPEAVSVSWFWVWKACGSWFTSLVMIGNSIIFKERRRSDLLYTLYFHILVSLSKLNEHIELTNGIIEHRKWISTHWCSGNIKRLTYVWILVIWLMIEGVFYSIKLRSDFLFIFFTKKCFLVIVHLFFLIGQCVIFKMSAQKLDDNQI